MIAASGLRRILRQAAPWIAGAICLEIGLYIVWPQQLKSALADKAKSERLASVVPDEARLRSNVDGMAQDSARLAARLELARSRHIEGSDPAAILASRVVPMLAERGWKLERVKADASNGSVFLDVGAATTFDQAIQGLEDIRLLPFSVKVRKLSLRPGQSGRLALDIQLAVPARGTR